MNPKQPVRETKDEWLERIKNEQDGTPPNKTALEPEIKE